MKKGTNSKKLNIVFIDFDDIKNPLLGAGQAKATLEIGKRLAEKGHKVRVICSKYPGYKDRTENGIEYKHIGLGSKNIRLNNIFYILSIPFAVLNIKRANIIIECFTAPISTLFSPLFTKTPVVALTTSFEAEDFARIYHLPIISLIEKIGVRFYKYFLPYTQYYDQKIKNLNPKAITKIVPEGVGEEFFQIKKKNPKYILYLGRLDIEHKGLDLLLKAYSLIAEKTTYPLIIAGNGPDEVKIKSLITKLNLSKKVKMIGPTFGKKKSEVLSEALFVAFPSRQEGFPLFSLEALASGLPLVAFDIPGLSWTNKEVALKTNPYNVKSYASLLLNATNYSLVKKMSRASREFAKQYTWNNVSDKFESFFYEILEKEGQNEN